MSAFPTSAIRPGRKVRFLFEEDIARFRDHAVKCGPCVNAICHRKEQQIAYCSKHRMMVGTTTPILCREFAKG